MRAPASIIRVVAAILLTAFCASAAEKATSNEVGIEGDVEITLNNGNYLPKPLDDRTPLILRIEKIEHAADGRFVYSFHYIGFESGPHKLVNYLINPDGSPATEVGDFTVNVESILPPDYMGELNAYVPRPFPWFGGYRMLLGALATVWVLGLFAFSWIGRRKKTAVVIEQAPPPPGYAERMRPLVEQAAAGKLSASGQAELERLMTGYWREKISLHDPRMADALAAMKRHPEAGAILRALERWLHRPGGASREEINSLLEPYRHTPVVSEEVRA
jgi:hypothetical protein